MSKTTAVIGAGSWGTALALHASECGHHVKLWVHSNDTLQILQQERMNRTYLPGFLLPETIELTQDPACVGGADYVIFSVPSLYFRNSFRVFLPYLPSNAMLISSIKGMESESGKRISQIIVEMACPDCKYAVLSGPSFALEVAQKHPTAVVIGTENKQDGKQIQLDFSSAYFRLYYNADIPGIEIGASIKNIIAIAAGVVSGLGYGYNTLSGLITRGLVEMNRLAIHLGANPSTLSGLAGLGDLILTCTGHLSRNRQVGIALGKGKTIDDITGSMRMIAEGVRTTEAVYRLASDLKISMPITEQVYRVIYEKHDPGKAILELMSRELKEE